MIIPLIWKKKLEKENHELGKMIREKTSQSEKRQEEKIGGGDREHGPTKGDQRRVMIYEVSSFLLHG